ncbi:MAG: hypothetical protein JXR64_01470 [Spirochaetales bacterium]|nr:hypothetical protein [Spirochaetales bacterium]
MRKLIAMIALFLCFSTNVFTKTYSQLDELFDQDLSRNVNGETLKIDRNGNVYYNEFYFKLFDFPDDKKINQFIAYETLIYQDYILADIFMDTSDGGERFTVFANYKTNNIIFHNDYWGFPSGLKKVVGYKKFIIFIYSGGVHVFDTLSGTYAWKNIWNEFFDNDDYNILNSIKEFKVSEEYLEVMLKSNKKIKLDYISGTLK